MGVLNEYSFEAMPKVHWAQRNLGKFFRLYMTNNSEATLQLKNFIVSFTLEHSFPVVQTAKLVQVADIIGAASFLHLHTAEVHNGAYTGYLVSLLAFSIEVLQIYIAFCCYTIK